MKPFEHHLLPQKAQTILKEAQKRCEAMGNRFGRDKVLCEAIADVRRLWPDCFVERSQDKERSRAQKPFLQFLH
ncbi:MAG: hypothetical protein SOT13_01375 [Candidatus Aphodousia sp.]|nr:hypothetical protein [Sutterella sp.]MDY2899165.1 hypothetical protein [Candidatus Aphodousia sp.]